MDWKEKYKIGSQWRNRNGDTAEVYGHYSGNEFHKFQFKARHSLGGTFAHYENGKIGGNLSGYDLISPIPSPAEVEREFKVGDLVTCKSVVHPDWVEGCKINGAPLEHLKAPGRITKLFEFSSGVPGAWIGDDYNIPLLCLFLIKAVEEKDNLEKLDEELKCNKNPERFIQNPATGEIILTWTGCQGEPRTNLTIGKKYSGKLNTKQDALIFRDDNDDTRDRLLIEFKEWNSELQRLEKQIVLDPIPKPVANPAYLKSSNGAPVYFPDVKKESVSACDATTAWDRTVNSRSKMAVFNVRDCVTRLETTKQEFGLINNADRKSMLTELEQVQKLAGKLTQKIKESM